MQALSYLVGAGSLVCWIMILIDMFKHEKILSGILGIICGLWAFIWGWQNTAKTGKKQLMVIWTLLIIAGVILNGSLAFKGGL